MYFEPKKIKEIAQRLNNKEVGIFPCDTIWGLIGLLEDNVVERLYEIKNRPADAPFLILIPHIKFLDTLTSHINTQHIEMMGSYWPGPLTLIFPKSSEVSDRVSAKKPTIGIRLPEYLPLNYLLLLLNRPIISTSVNLSKTPSALTPETFPQEILDKVDFSYTDIPPRLGKESDVVDCTASPFKVLRKSLLFND